MKSSFSHHDDNLSYRMYSSQDIVVEQTSTVTDRRSLKSRSRQTVNVLEITSVRELRQKAVDREI